MPVSCGAVLVVAGASKLYRGIRGLDDVTAVRRALRSRRRHWRLFGLAAGAAECVTGAVVCSGAYRVLGGASLATLGAVFCAVLAYVLVKRVPGSCGCIRWRAATGTAARSANLAGNRPQRNAAQRQAPRTWWSQLMPRTRLARTGSVAGLRPG